MVDSSDYVPEESHDLYPEYTLKEITDGISYDKQIAYGRMTPRHNRCKFEIQINISSVTVSCNWVTLCARKSMCKNSIK